MQVGVHTPNASVDRLTDSGQHPLVEVNANAPPPHTHTATLHDPDAWLLGFGWDETQWGDILPDRTWLDAAAPGRRALLLRMDGHRALASTAALQTAGLWPTAPSLGECGAVHVDAQNQPTGILTCVFDCLGRG